MTKCKCIAKFRNKHGRVWGYALICEDGRQISISSDQLKQDIHNKQIEVINLKLTSDGRLVDIFKGNNIDKEYEYRLDKPIRDMITKARMLGIPIYESCPAFGQKIYTVYKDELNMLVLIPSYVKRINSGDIKYDTHEFKGNIKLIGGSGLESTDGLFYGSTANSIDLSELDTTNVTSMQEMFKNCRAKQINFINFKTNNVINVNNMFNNCKTKVLDISSFNLNNIDTAFEMFMDCGAEDINFGNCKINPNAKIDRLFTNCNAKITTIDTLILNKYSTRECYY